VSIRLHKKLGINPRLTTQLCIVCLKKVDGNEIVMLGSNNHYSVCPKCGLRAYGGKPDKGYCPKCTELYGNHWERVELKETDKIHTGTTVCDKCKKLLKNNIALIKTTGSAHALTGDVVVVAEKTCIGFLEAQKCDEAFIDSVKSKRVLMLDEKDWKAAGLDEAQKRYAEAQDD